MQIVSSFISPLTGVNTSNMLEKLNFITGAVQEFVWSVSYPVLILNSWLFQPFQLKFCWQQVEKQAEQTGKPFWLGARLGWHCLPGRVNFALQAPDCNRKFSLFRQEALLSSAWKKTCWMKCVSERGSGRALKLQGVRVALRQNLAAQHGVAQWRLFRKIVQSIRTVFWILWSS